jgi:RNA polymerase sigma factor (sigma-70 family)
MKQVLRELRRLTLQAQAAHLTNGQLLAAFQQRRDEAAFEELVRRLGPMVLGVCRRVLHEHADVEDAFQATFVVLFRQARSVRTREKVGSWLHSVAYRTAMNARLRSAKRRRTEQQAAGTEPMETLAPPEQAELLHALHAELDRLPAKYREPLILYYLERKGYKETAALLAIPEGTLSSRLDTGRKRLAQRLAHFGGAGAAAALAASLTAGLADGASVAVPTTLFVTTVQAASGTLAPRVAALAQGVSSAMIVTNWKAAASVALVSLSLGLMAYGQTQGTRGGLATSPQRTAPPAANDLQTLRLELEALRGTVDALQGDVSVLRRRVKQLEDAAPARTGGGTTPSGDYRESVPATGASPSSPYRPSYLRPLPGKPATTDQPVTGYGTTPPTDDKRQDTHRNSGSGSSSAKFQETSGAILDRIEKDLRELLRRRPDDAQRQGELQKVIRDLRQGQSNAPENRLQAK